jgi:hypothetical protein
MSGLVYTNNSAVLPSPFKQQLKTSSFISLKNKTKSWTARCAATPVLNANTKTFVKVANGHFAISALLYVRIVATAAVACVKTWKKRTNGTDVASHVGVGQHNNSEKSNPNKRRSELK